MDLSALLHLVYPKICGACDDMLLAQEQFLCTKCYLQLPFTKMPIHNNLVTDRLLGRFPIVNGHSLFYLEKDNIVQKLLHNVKYKDKKQLGVYLGKIWGRTLQPHLKNAQIDFIVPMPLSQKKLHHRGYNQSVLLGEGLSEVLEIPLHTQLVKRVKHTESQTSKNRMQRVLNIDGAFAATPYSRNAKHILLLDDVITTGATIDLCANAILEAYPDMKISVGALSIKMQ